MASPEGRQGSDASPIVVGVSGVTGSRAALQWAAREAQLRRGRVDVVAVMAWRGSGLPGGAPGRVPGQSVTDASLDQRKAEQLLSEFVVEALGEDHGVQCRAVEGSARSVLVREAESASLLVLDSPSMAKLYEPGAGRLASKLIFRSPCPVVVMPALAVDEDFEDDLGDDLGEYAGEAERVTTGSRFRR
jgi:Universal stress protein family